MGVLRPGRPICEYETTSRWQNKLLIVYDAYTDKVHSATFRARWCRDQGGGQHDTRWSLSNGPSGDVGLLSEEDVVKQQPLSLHVRTVR